MENAILNKLQALRMVFTLQILLDSMGLTPSVFFLLSFESKIDTDTEISQQIMRIYRDNNEYYDYNHITLELRKTLEINHKEVQRIINILVRRKIREKIQTYQD